MEHRLDPLIAERAPWLYKPGHLATCARGILHRALSYDDTLNLAKVLEHQPAEVVMQTMFQRLGQFVEVQGLSNIPRHEPALIVANHPTGIADGIILYGLLTSVRPDPYFFANQDILRTLPQLDEMIAPVEWRTGKRSHAKTRETMAFVRTAIDANRLGVIFPSGRLAKRRGLQLHERPWMPSAAMLALKFDLPVIPVNIRARNSALFYLLDMIHPTLRDITLFHETLNKDRQPFSIVVGEPIQQKTLPKSSKEGIEILRNATLALRHSGPSNVGAIKTARVLTRS